MVGNSQEDDSRVAGVNTNRYRKGIDNMGERALQNRIRRLQALDLQQAEIEAEKTRLKEEIKKDMEKKGINQIKTGNFIIRCKKIISNRFDSKRFRAEHEDLYSRYQKQHETERFTVTKGVC